MNGLFASTSNTAFSRQSIVLQNIGQRFVRYQLNIKPFSMRKIRWKFNFAYDVCCALVTRSMEKVRHKFLLMNWIHTSRPHNHHREHSPNDQPK